jgi:glycosyltransferase involved in cell wall biosynthesis
MKIALLHFCLEDYTIALANSLINYVDLTLIQQEKCSKACENVLDPRIPVLTFKKPDMRYPSNVLAMGQVMRLIDKVSPDILHVQETNDIWYLLMLLLNKMPPVVTTIHDLFSHPGDNQKVFASDYTRPIAFYRSQQLIVHTHIHKKNLNQKFYIPNHKINVFQHGELGSLYKCRSPNDNTVREPYTLLFFGRIWPYKGLKYLLEAMPSIAEKIPEVKLIIAGRGESIDKYFPHGYDRHRYKILNHFITNKDVINLFKRSTIAILPYIEASQSGVAALSYGMGTPVVASDIGGLSEIVRHQEDGLLVAPGDTQALADGIISLLTNRRLYENMQAAMMVRCQQDLNWANIAAHTVEIYRKILR